MPYPSPKSSPGIAGIVRGVEGQAAELCTLRAGFALFLKAPIAGTCSAAVMVSDPNPLCRDAPVHTACR